MLNATTGGCVMPRELFKWMDSLDLSFSVKNPRVDLANGYIVAELLSRYYPKEVSIYTYYNNQAKDKRINNWEQIQKVLARKEFTLTKEDYEGIANLGPDQALGLLYRLYEFLTKKKLNLSNRTIVPEEAPLYTKPTASHLAKDRELARIVDDNQKLSRTKNLITTHLGQIKTQKYNSGLIEWLISKRKQQIQEEVARQQEEITRRTKSLAYSEIKGEIKEIQLKCFNSSTSKKAKGQQGDFMEVKGTVDFLMDSCMFILRKEPIVRDIKALGLQLKESGGQINILSELFIRCDELDAEGYHKVQARSLELLLDQFSQPSEVGLAVENIYNNFVDFKKYFFLFLKPLTVYKPEDQVFRSVLQLVQTITSRLHQNDSQSTHLLFRSLLLRELLKVANDRPQKRAAVAQICLFFTRSHTVDQYETVIKVKEALGTDTKLYVAYLAHFIEAILKLQGEVEQSLWNELYFYANGALTSPSPHTRANGCKIISELIVFNEKVYTDRLDRLKKLAHDNWWEVRAQTLIILSRLLIAHRKGVLDKSGGQPEPLDDNLSFRTIFNYVLEIFRNGVTHNILRIGLVELAELLNYESELCERYLDVLLNISEEIRLDVLKTDGIKIGPVVFGCNTFTYRLTGAPLEWNAVGIARALDQNIRANRLQRVSKEHLDILHSALSSYKESAESKTVWLDIYKNLKQYIYGALADEALCVLASAIIKQFFLLKDLQPTIMQLSKEHFKGFLSKQRDLSLGGVKQGHTTETNMLSLFEHFNGLGEDFREYTYQILKEFSEEERQRYLQSSFVDFMNELARKRRAKLFSEI